MAKEIERKFLVRSREFESEAVSRLDIRQAYLSTAADATVRLRVSGEQAWLTVKSRNHGCERGEWEYPVAVSDALEMIAATGCRCIHKYRYIVPAGHGLVWEVDEFVNPANGLVVAEIELPSADTPFEIPLWLGAEVTGDTRYYNSEIVKSLS